MRHLLSLSSLAIAACVLTACAAAPAGRPPDRAEPGLTGSSAAQMTLEQAIAHFEQVLDAARAGRSESAAGELADARARVQTAAVRCIDADDCDDQRVVAAYDALLQRVRPHHLGSGEGFAAIYDDDARVPSDAGDASPVVTHLPEAERTVSLLNGRELRDVIALNGPVKAALTEWLTWMRPNLIEAYENYRYLRYLMWPEYEQAGLPEALLFGILAKESGGKVHAVSRAGASGPLQFMYATGRRYGLGDSGGFDTRFDPQLATRANVLYLNDRFAELNHNLELALAAYNGGEGRAQRLFEASGGKPFWDPDMYWQWPAETRDYVPMVLAAAWLFLHPEDYGLEFPQVAATPSELTLARETSIDELSICLGNSADDRGWFRVLRNLNPRYLPDTRLPLGTTLRAPTGLIERYRLRCVDSPMADLAVELTAARSPTPPQPTRYTVRRGDSLHAIARRHGCSVRQLASANGIDAPRYLIRVGQQIALAGCRG